jgi:hypothetical protein
MKSWEKFISLDFFFLVDVGVPLGQTTRDSSWERPCCYINSWEVYNLFLASMNTSCLRREMQASEKIVSEIIKATYYVLVLL